MDAKHIHKEAHSIHFLHLLFFPQRYNLTVTAAFALSCGGFPKSYCLFVLRPALSCVYAFTCAAVISLGPFPFPPHPSPPPSLPLSLHSLTSILSSWLVFTHSRQRQNNVGMNTPNATRMGNIRLLLSAAYGLGVRGPDWTLFLEPGGSFFFPPSSPTSISSSSSSSSSCFSKPGWGWSLGTSVK